ncbi:hypothetical protein UFOVP133_24 [uncultured Caudovirales phage]|uniref:Uncharacterized protein n=1 Tax=uncultured Caudovirales phage TaxID=2100421 RepID=A0A6J5LBK4_9CAUD|nr:hypothetical protein UFOVP133_24 [uncultured Caudovirales phage]
MLYHAIYHPPTHQAVVRPADHGVSDNEWRHGCRVLAIYSPFLTKTSELVKDCGYYLVDNHEWSDHIASLDDPGLVTNNKFVSTRVVRDKWDSDRPIY